MYVRILPSCHPGWRPPSYALCMYGVCQCKYRRSVWGRMHQSRDRFFLPNRGGCFRELLSGKTRVPGKVGRLIYHHFFSFFRFAPPHPLRLAGASWAALCAARLGPPGTHPGMEQEGGFPATSDERSAAAVCEEWVTAAGGEEPATKPRASTYKQCRKREQGDGASGASWRSTGREEEPMEGSGDEHGRPVTIL